MGGAPPGRRSTIAALQTYSHTHDEEWGAFPPTEVAAAAAAFIAYFCQLAHTGASNTSMRSYQQVPKTWLHHFVLLALSL